MPFWRVLGDPDNSGGLNSGRTEVKRGSDSGSRKCPLAVLSETACSGGTRLKGILEGCSLQQHVTKGSLSYLSSPCFSKNVLQSGVGIVH